MTEQEWLTATDPTEMLKAHQGKFSERKLRLFALACCERIRRFITDPRSLAAVEFAWRHVETTPNRKPGRPKIEKAARAAHTEAYAHLFGIADVVERHRQLIRSVAADAAHEPLATSPEWAAEYAASFAAIAVGWEWVIENKPELLPNYSPAYREIEHHPQADLLRDITGNPYHPMTFAPALRTETARALASGIYSETAFDRLPILADALEDAGCDHAELLAHCRDPKLVHVKGCWVVDLVLGKS